MKYKIVVGKLEAEIEEEEIEKVLKLIQVGSIVVAKHIVFNPSYFVGIIRDEKREEISAENRRYGIEEDKNNGFVSLLGDKIKMLPKNGK